MTDSVRIREIPYNYTSFSDREIVLRYLGAPGWEMLNQLRAQRVTGRSARMLFEVLGDMWVIDRNPYLQDDMLADRKRRHHLLAALQHRLDQINARAKDNPLALQLETLTRQATERFAGNLNRQAHLRTALRTQLHGSSKDNICFDGLARVSHATDATDWRVELPLAVLTPDNEAEIPTMLGVCSGLELTIIPRGGGTGYTGSGVPLSAYSVVINTEKLDFVGPIETLTLPGCQRQAPTICVGAGAVTRKVADAAHAAGFIFAVDPTSMDASTIGGNIAMNAGGKKAVRWGTTLDNLVSWRMLCADGEWLEIERLDHNLGKIHDQAIARFRVTYFGTDGMTPVGEPRLIEAPGRAFRKLGLGKDVTDKALFELPGMQKEGCDGLITAARFVLYPQPAALRTVCLEFFGTVGEAVPAIQEIIEYLHHIPEVELTGLEHLDARYIRAVNYTTKAARLQLPTMVLLADIAGHHPHAVDQAAQAVVALAELRHGVGFIAVSTADQRRFWADRARTAAIAAHTNAFKINEDVVIPLAQLGAYTDGIERLNIEYSLRNKLAIIQALRAVIADQAMLLKLWEPEVAEPGTKAREIITDKQCRAIALLDEVAAQWQVILAQLDHSTPTGQTWFQRLQSGEERISLRVALRQPLQEIFAGQAFYPLRQTLLAEHARVRNSRLFIACHAHAGDGNVHTNIPVHSNDYDMMRQAEQIVHQIMALAQSLGGSISGEHGIGLTKYQFLEAEKIEAFVQYKQQADPHNIFNRGKLLPGSGLENAYTPSLRLLEQEALILEAQALETLNEAVKNCLRCGKCKAVCTTHVPRANLLYSPRNKILALGLLIEAILYEEQTRRGIAPRHFEALLSVSDHCTVCHRCVKPCPVNIDFGEVTVKIRQALRTRNLGRKSLAAGLGMKFLDLRHSTTIAWMRTILRGAYSAQRLAHHWLRPVTKRLLKRPSATVERPSLTTQVIHFVAKPLPAIVAAQPLRRMLQLEDDKRIAILCDPNVREEVGEAVFYFPGCGSERLFSEVGLATLAMLYHLGEQVVLPPGYLCCGYPQTAAGEDGSVMTTHNRILFHRMANTLNYLDIKTVIVSCGTCLDQLETYHFEQIFPGCRLLDIHEFLLEKGVTLPPGSTPLLYHDPCHTPMKQHPALEVVSSLLGKSIPLSDRCCAEAGTFAVNRPDIASQAQMRKIEEIRANLNTLAADHATILTSCPACKQGLSRYQADLPITTRYVVEEIALQVLGDTWQQQFIERLRHGGIEQVLL